MPDKVYDLIGVGVGPFNLGLAALAEPIAELDSIFFDMAKSYDWHPGMMIEAVTLQTPFMADLVTLADPTSPYSFLNYMKQQGKIYSFYIRESFFLLRQEYNLYCQWVIQKLSNVKFQSKVEQVSYCQQQQLYLVNVICLETNEVTTYRSKKIVLGTGPKPYWPESSKKLVDYQQGTVIHSGQYLFEKQKLQQHKSITIVGSGQSAAEIFYDLLVDIDQYGYELTWVTRAPRFFPLEYTKLTLEMTSPEYVDYFYNLPAQQRDQLNQQQKNLFKGINQELINQIFDTLYIKNIEKKQPIHLWTNSAWTDTEIQSDQLTLSFHQSQEKVDFKHKTQGLVVATGYAYQAPECIQSIQDRIRKDEQGRFLAHRHYAIDHKGNEIFVQNAEYNTHGFVTPDLGMACYRNSVILKQILGKAPYPIEETIAFQQFSAKNLR